MNEWWTRRSELECIIFASPHHSMEYIATIYAQVLLVVIYGKSQTIFVVIQLTVHRINIIMCKYLQVSKLLSALSLDSHSLRLRDV